MEKKLSDKILDTFFTVHRILGPGFPEACYEEAITRELDELQIPYERQKKFVVDYKDKPLSKTFRVDILVDNKIIVEVKACADILPVHHAQVIAYLKAADKSLGYLVNFNEHLIKNGIHRKVWQFIGEEYL